MVEYTRGITKCYQWPKAGILLNQLRLKGLQPDLITYNALISASRACWNVALLWFLELQVDHQADAWWILLKLYSCYRGKEPAWKFPQFPFFYRDYPICEWGQVQLPLKQRSQDVITFGATMRAYEEAAEWQRALALLGELEKEVKANTVLGRL